MGIYCYMVPMPFTIKACASPDENGIYTIYINSLLTYEQQKEGYLHELKHINNNHFYMDCCINSIEAVVHGV